jgi:DNA-binding Lrp family transcriptional regulator
MNQDWFWDTHLPDAQIARLEGAETTALRRRVALMRELGVIQAFGIILGPEPRAPSRIEKLKKEVLDDDPRAKKLLALEEAREEIRSRIGNWDISNEKLDELVDPSLLEE